jgi:hypothetical protein
MNKQTQGARERIKHAATVEIARQVMREVSAGGYPAAYVKRCQRALAIRENVKA